MRTCTVMIFTDGKRSVYGVFRGEMIGRAFDAHHAEQIAAVEYTERDFDYRECTAKHATTEAPPVYWQR